MLCELSLTRSTYVFSQLVFFPSLLVGIAIIIIIEKTVAQGTDTNERSQRW